MPRIVYDANDDGSFGLAALAGAAGAAQGLEQSRFSQAQRDNQIADMQFHDQQPQRLDAYQYAMRKMRTDSLRKALGPDVQPGMNDAIAYYEQTGDHTPLSAQLNPLFGAKQALVNAQTNLAGARADAVPAQTQIRQGMLGVAQDRVQNQADANNYRHVYNTARLDETQTHNRAMEQGAIDQHSNRTEELALRREAQTAQAQLSPLDRIVLNQANDTRVKALAALSDARSKGFSTPEDMAALTTQYNAAEQIYQRVLSDIASKAGGAGVQGAQTGGVGVPAGVMPAAPAPRYNVARPPTPVGRLSEQDPDFDRAANQSGLAQYRLPNGRVLSLTPAQINQAIAVGKRRSPDAAGPDAFVSLLEELYGKTK